MIAAFFQDFSSFLQDVLLMIYVAFLFIEMYFRFSGTIYQLKLKSQKFHGPYNGIRGKIFFGISSFTLSFFLLEFIIKHPLFVSNHYSYCKLLSNLFHISLCNSSSQDVSNYIDHLLQIHMCCPATKRHK